MRRLSRQLLGLARTVLVVLIVVYALFPFYWAIVSSLKSGQALFDTALLPGAPRT